MFIFFRSNRYDAEHILQWTIVDRGRPYRFGIYSASRLKALELAVFQSETEAEA